MSNMSDPLRDEVENLLNRTDSLLSASSGFSPGGPGGRRFSEGAKSPPAQQYASGTTQSLLGFNTGGSRLLTGRAASVSGRPGSSHAGVRGLGVGGVSTPGGIGMGGLGTDALSDAANRLRSSFDAAASKLDALKKQTSFREPLSIDIPRSLVGGSTRHEVPEAPTPRLDSPAASPSGRMLPAPSVALTERSMAVLDRSASMTSRALSPGAARPYNSFAGLQDMVSAVDELVTVTQNSPVAAGSTARGSALGIGSAALGSAGLGANGVSTTSIRPSSRMGSPSFSPRSPHKSRLRSAGGAVPPPSSGSKTPRRTQLAPVLAKELLAAPDVAKFKSEFGGQPRAPSGVPAAAAQLQEKIDKLQRRLNSWHLVEEAAVERFSTALDAALDAIFSKIDLSWPPPRSSNATDKPSSPRSPHANPAPVAAAAVAVGRSTSKARAAQQQLLRRSQGRVARRPSRLSHMQGVQEGNLFADGSGGELQPSQWAADDDHEGASEAASASLRGALQNGMGGVAGLSDGDDAAEAEDAVGNDDDDEVELAAAATARGRREARSSRGRRVPAAPAHHPLQQQGAWPSVGQAVGGGHPIQQGHAGSGNGMQGTGPPAGAGGSQWHGVHQPAASSAWPPAGSLHRPAAAGGGFAPAALFVASQPPSPMPPPYTPAVTNPAYQTVSYKMTPPPAPMYSPSQQQQGAPQHQPGAQSGQGGPAAGYHGAPPPASPAPATPGYHSGYHSPGQIRSPASSMYSAPPAGYGGSFKAPAAVPYGQYSPSTAAVTPTSALQALQQYATPTAYGQQHGVYPGMQYGYGSAPPSAGVMPTPSARVPVMSPTASPSTAAYSNITLAPGQDAPHASYAAAYTPPLGPQGHIHPLQEQYATQQPYGEQSFNPSYFDPYRAAAEFHGQGGRGGTGSPALGFGQYTGSPYASPGLHAVR